MVMMTRSRCSLVAAWLVALSLAAGCVPKKDPPEVVDLKQSRDLIEETVTLRMNGYAADRVVKASVAEVRRYLADPANIGLAGIELRLGAALTGPEGLDRAGAGVPFAIGGAVTGTVVTARAAADELALIWVLPDTLMVERFEFKAVRDMTEVRVSFFVQDPEGGAQLPGAAASYLSDGLFPDVDAMLDRMADRLGGAGTVAPVGGRDDGLAGEKFETLFQATKTTVRIAADSGRVIQWMKNQRSNYLAEIKWDGGSCPTPAMKTGDILYCHGFIEVPPIKMELDSLNTKDVSNIHRTTTSYFVAAGLVGVLDERIKPAGDDQTVMSWLMAFEIPQNMSSSSMETIMFLANIPQSMRAKAIMIKTGVEGNDLNN